MMNPHRLVSGGGIAIAALVIVVAGTFGGAAFAAQAHPSAAVAAPSGARASATATRVVTKSAPTPAPVAPRRPRESRQPRKPGRGGHGGCPGQPRGAVPPWSSHFWVTSLGLTP